MAGAVGSAAQTLEETIEWLEDETLYVSRHVDLSTDGQVVITSESGRRIEFHMEKLYSHGLGEEGEGITISDDGRYVVFLCDDSWVYGDSDCIEYVYSSYPKGIYYLPIAHEEDGRNMERAAKIRKAFLRYKELATALQSLPRPP